MQEKEGISPEELFGIETRKTERAYYMADSSLTSIIDSLKRLPRAAESEKENIRKEIEQNREILMHAVLSKIEGILDRHLLRFRNPYPYDSRYDELWFDVQREALERAGLEIPSGNEEAGAWLDRLVADIRWGESTFSILVGLGVPIEKFFDGKRMMSEWVRERLRSDPVSTFYELAYASEPAGLSVNRGPLPETAKEGLREKAIKYQDDSVFWRMAVAAVHQIDLDDTAGDKKTFMNEKLSQAKIRFIREIFRIEEENEKSTVSYKGQQVPREILNWYAMPSKELLKRKYLATMEVLLTEGALDKVNLLERETPDGKSNYDENGLMTLVRELKEKIDYRLKTWHSPKKDLDSRLAGVVARAGIIWDLGHFSVVEMAWGWNYNEKKEQDPATGKEKVVGVEREKAVGGTTVATDIPNMAKWLSYYASTGLKSWTVGMLPPMSQEFMKTLAKEKKNGWLPNEEELKTKAGKDHKTQQALQKLWGPGADFNKWSEAVVLKNEEKIEDEFEKMVWYWETPFKDRASGENIVIPIFFPPELKSLNFWNTISLSEDKKVWDQLCSGTKLSEIRWENMNDQALYRWMITISQTVRILVVMTEQETPANEPQFKDFFASPGRARELLKRIDLGVRDEKERQAFLTLSLAPLLVVLYTAKKHNILGGGWKNNRQGWGAEVAKWVAAFRDLPTESQDKTFKKDYGNALARFTKFYAKLIARLAEEAYLTEEGRIGRIYNDEIRKEIAELGISAPEVQAI